MKYRRIQGISCRSLKSVFHPIEKALFEALNVRRPEPNFNTTLFRQLLIWKQFLNENRRILSLSNFSSKNSYENSHVLGDTLYHANAFLFSKNFKSLEKYNDWQLQNVSGLVCSFKNTRDIALFPNPIFQQIHAEEFVKKNVFLKMAKKGLKIIFLSWNFVHPNILAYILT